MTSKYLIFALLLLLVSCSSGTDWNEVLEADSEFKSIVDRAPTQEDYTPVGFVLNWISANRDVSYCEFLTTMELDSDDQLAQQGARDDCVVNFATASDNPELCADSGSEEGWCYNSLALYSKNAVSFKQREEWCSNAKDWKQDCYNLVSQFATIEDCKTSWNSDDCLIGLGVFSEDASVCGLVSKSSSTRCFAQLGSYVKDSDSICSQSVDPGACTTEVVRILERRDAAIDDLLDEMQSSMCTDDPSNELCTS
jgi:hypothetical protein